MTRSADHEGTEEICGAAVSPIVPMFEEATHLPGHASVTFTPLQFYALSRVQRLDVDPSAEGLWLVEEACPEVTKNGIAFFDRQFTHEDIQAYITGLPNTPRRDLVIRYNKALLARGVLQELILCERLAGGRIVERLRCRTRERVMAERDPNAAHRHKERFLAVLRAKITRAQEERLTLLHGDAAVAAFRDEQTARAQRQRGQRPAPMAAKPIRARSRADAAARDATQSVRAIADHLAGGVSVDEPDAPESVDVTEAVDRAMAADDRKSDAKPRRVSTRDSSGPTNRSSTRSAERAGSRSRTRSSSQATGQRSGSHTLALGARTRGPDASDTRERQESAGTQPSMPRRSNRSNRSAETQPAAGSSPGARTDAPPSPHSPRSPSSLLDALGGRAGFFCHDDD